MDLKGQFTGLGFIKPLNGVVFDPATLMAVFTSMSAGTAGTIGAVTSVMAPVLSVAGALSGVASAQRQGAEYDRAAQESEIAANVEAARARRYARQVQSKSKASMAEAGVLSGTSLGLLEQNAAAMELDALTVEFRGEQQAKGQRFQGEQARKSATFLDVFSTAVKGFSQVDPLNLAPNSGLSTVGKGGYLNTRKSTYG